MWGKTKGKIKQLLSIYPGQMLKYQIFAKLVCTMLHCELSFAFLPIKHKKSLSSEDGRIYVQEVYFSNHQRKDIDVSVPRSDMLGTVRINDDWVIFFNFK